MPHFDTDLFLGQFFPSFEQLENYFKTCDQLMLNLFSDENYSVLSYIGRRENKRKIIIIIILKIRGALWVLKIEENKVSPIFLRTSNFGGNFATF